MVKIDALCNSLVERGTGRYVLTTYIYPKKGADHIEISLCFREEFEAREFEKSVNEQIARAITEHPLDVIDLGRAIIPANNIAYVEHVLEGVD